VASAVVVDRGARHVLLRRLEAHGRWQLVGGHVAGGETLSEAARREVREQAGLTRLRVIEPHVALQQDLVECRGVQARHVDHVFAVVVDPTEPVTEGFLDEDQRVGWFPVSELPEPLAPGVRLHLSGTRRLLDVV
jgi:ADP-ribose pyrophosphatase YjhB (NUDIX family)